MDVTSNIGSPTCTFQTWTPAMGRVFEGTFAYDAETTRIDEDHPEKIPDVVLATACDQHDAVVIAREHLPAFFEAHGGCGIICHNAAFDLAVTQKLLGAQLDLYVLVEQGRVWDTMILHRLWSLATEGHTARGKCSLADTVRLHLGLELDKRAEGAGGEQVRLNFGQLLGQPIEMMPASYLRYATTDTHVTWLLFWKLHAKIQNVLRGAPGVWGYVDGDWLRDVTQRFGPLTHHLQLRAAILTDVLRRNGIGINRERVHRLRQALLARRDEAKSRLEARGLIVSGNGSQQSIQAVLADFHHKHPEVPLRRTAKARGWSASEDALLPLAEYDSLFTDYLTYKSADKLLSTYIDKLDRNRLHARFGYLLHTGRMFCGGGFNLQNLPRDGYINDEGGKSQLSVRSCFVPAAGGVFVDVDYRQIELVVLAYVLEHQFGFGTSLQQLINAGEDVHRLIAAAVLNKDAADVTKSERNSAKAVSFGRPGGMGVGGLREYARKSYGQDLNDDEVRARIDAYHRLCPELSAFLDDGRDSGMVIAQAAGMSPAELAEATRDSSEGWGANDDSPQGWLGGMLLKVLREPAPVRNGGRGHPYTFEEVTYFWRKAQDLEIELPPGLKDALVARCPSPELAAAVRNWASCRYVITITGRIRANSSFCESRNTCFQGPAADGMILGMWEVWRAGYRIVSAIHDEVVVECPANDTIRRSKADIERLLIQGMQVVVPNMRVEVEGVITSSLDKEDEITADQRGKLLPKVRDSAVAETG